MQISFSIRTALLTILIFLASCASPDPALVSQPSSGVSRPEPSKESQALPLVAFVTTGGTISEKEKPSTGDLVPALSGEELIASVPGLDKKIQAVVYPVCAIDSKDMTPELWIKIAKQVRTALQDEKVQGVVVVHGTDTMEESAWFIQLTVQSEKPIIFTGAMLGASDFNPDGPRNLLNAATQAIDPASKKRGTTLTLNGQIYGARSVTKINTNNTRAFGSARGERLGEIDCLGAHWFATPDPTPSLPLPETLPRVEILSCYPGANGDLVEAATDRGAKGLVIIGYGIGNTNEEFYKAVAKARKKGIPIALTSRVADGRIYPSYGGPGGGSSYKEIGVLFSSDLLPWKARILLMLGMANGLDQEGLEKLFGAL